MPGHSFVAGGDDSTYGPRGTWCQHGEGSEEGPCGKPADDHPTGNDSTQSPMVKHLGNALAVVVLVAAIAVVGCGIAFVIAFTAKTIGGM